LAGVLREVDRQINKNRYPVLFYPDVLILDGGYRQFHSCFPGDCEGGYCPVGDEPHHEAVGSEYWASDMAEYRASFAEYERGWKYYPLQEIGARHVGTISAGGGRHHRASSLPDGFRWTSVDDKL
jgi:hypothetical protein